MHNKDVTAQIKNKDSIVIYMCYISINVDANIQFSNIRYFFQIPLNEH